MKNKQQDVASNATSIAKIFNFIGATLIFFGLIYFIGSNWQTLSSFIKIFTTLGTATVAFAIGVLSSRNKIHPAMSGAFFMIAGLLLPFGLTVVADIFELSSPSLRDEIVISTICFSIFFVTNFYLRRDILRLFCVAFGSMFYFSLATHLIETYVTVHIYNLPEYLFFILGLGYLALGVHFASQKVTLSGPLYFLGSFCVLIASFNLGGLLLFPAVSPFWKILSPILVLESFLLAVPLRSKSLLYVGTLFLVIYLLSITALFPDFFGKFGWPLIFISAGIFLMLLGYFLLIMHRKIVNRH